MAERVAGDGAAVVIGARREDAGEQVAARIMAAYDRARFVPTDVTVEADVARLVETGGDEVRPAGRRVRRRGRGASDRRTPVRGRRGQARGGRPDAAAALECAAQGVRVNALITGTVDTALFRRLLGASPDDELDPGGLNPSQRTAEPREIAAFVASLLSDDAAFVTGAALAVDGSFTAQ